MREYKGNTLLIELTVAILFFALSQAIVLQVFAHAQQVNRNTQIQHHALVRAKDTAETLAVSDSAEDALLSLGFTADGAGYAVTDPEGYRLTADIHRLTQTMGVLTTVTLTAFQGDVLLFTLPAVRYQGGLLP